MIEEKIYRIEGFQMQVTYAGDNYVVKCNRLPDFGIEFPRAIQDKDFFIRLRRKIIQHVHEDLEISFGRRGNVIQIGVHRLKKGHPPRLRCV